MILNAYFSSNRAKEEGLPTVSFIASELNLSPNYFDDLIKKEKGNSPLEHIQSKVINLAKERIFAENKSYYHNFQWSIFNLEHLFYTNKFLH